MAAAEEEIARSASETVSALGRESEAPVRMVVGVTSHQTCLVLRGRLRVLREAGFVVNLVASPGEFLEDIARLEGVSAYPIPMRRGISPFTDLFSFLSIFKLLRRVRPAITDFSTPKAGLLGNLAAWMMRVPMRVYTLRGLKLESSSGVKRALLLWSERVAARCAHVVLCNSESLRDAAIRNGIAPESKLYLLGQGSSNGVDVERFRPGASTMRQELQIPDDAIVVGYVGRLTGNKGIPELLVAFEEILNAEPNCWLLLAGWFDRAEDALSDHWRRHIALHPRIRAVGYVEDTAACYRAMDIFVLPTHREGFPNVILEASASGLPVISTECTGARDAVVPEVTGLLVPPGIPKAITDAVLDLIRHPERRRRFGAAGRAWVTENYERGNVLAMAVEFYRGLVERQGLGDR